MKPTEELMQEHIVINLMLSILLKISDSIKAKNVFYTNDVENIVDFFFNYVDKRHINKEEKVFYQSLLSIDTSIVHFPIGSIIDEHSTGKRYLNEIISSVENCKIGGTFSCEKIADNMKKYVILIQNHIQKEENTLFPFANKALSDEMQNQISEKFKLIDIEFVLIGEYERCNELFNRMMIKYLN